VSASSPYANSRVGLTSIHAYAKPILTFLPIFLSLMRTDVDYLLGSIQPLPPSRFIWFMTVFTYVLTL
jgi:hypothetical protein